MGSPLAAYLTRLYFAYYAGLFAFAAAISALTIVRHLYALLLPFGFIASIALCAVAVHLGSRREFETLQSFGVSGRRVAAPLAVAALAPQLLWSLLVLANDSGRAAVYVAAVSFSGIAVALAIVLATTWARREPAVAAACVLGLGAQSILIVLGMALAAAR